MGKILIIINSKARYSKAFTAIIHGSTLARQRKDAKSQRSAQKSNLFPKSISQIIRKRNPELSVNVILDGRYL